MPIKFVPTYVTTDGKTYDDIDKAVIHERRRMVQHLLLDKRAELHLTLADIDKAAAIICAVQGPVAELFSEDLKGGMGNEALKKTDPALNATVAKVKNTFDASQFKVPRFPDGGLVDKRPDNRPVVPPVVHSDIRSETPPTAHDALGANLTAGDFVRMKDSPNRTDDLVAWGLEQYRVVEDIAGPGVVHIGGSIWPSHGLIKRAASDTSLISEDEFVTLLRG